MKNRSKYSDSDRVNFNKTVYIVEGPFDSLFIDNAIAMAGADVDWKLLEGKDVVFVFDNEKVAKRLSIA